MISLYDHGNVICCKEKQTFSFYAYNVTEGKKTRLYFLKQVSKGKLNEWKSYLGIQDVSKLEFKAFISDKSMFKNVVPRK